MTSTLARRANWARGRPTISQVSRLRGGKKNWSPLWGSEENLVAITMMIAWAVSVQEGPCEPHWSLVIDFLVAAGVPGGSGSTSSVLLSLIH